MSKLNLDRLNGWQRLFILFSVVWLTYYFLVEFKSPAYVAPSEYFYEFLPSSEDRTTLSGLDQVIEILQSNKQYKTKDGKTHLLFEKYTEQQLAEADALSSKKAEQVNSSIFLDSFANVLKYSLGPLAITFLFGCMVSWVIKGFKK